MIPFAATVILGVVVVVKGRSPSLLHYPRTQLPYADHPLHRHGGNVRSNREQPHQASDAKYRPGGKRRTFSHIYKHGSLVVEQDGGCNRWERTECKGARFYTDCVKTDTRIGSTQGIRKRYKMTGGSMDKTAAHLLKVHYVDKKGVIPRKTVLSTLLPVSQVLVSELHSTETNSSGCLYNGSLPHTSVSPKSRIPNFVAS
jgi:hypothetical protein